MDRRQRKTRAAIFDAFTFLLSRKTYDRITIQEIITQADVGRTTFYAHFDTKEDLLKALCRELFGHILDSAADHRHAGSYSNEAAPPSVFCHILQHLQQNEHQVLTLLDGENSDLFMRYFKNSLSDLIQTQLLPELPETGLPEAFLTNHLCASFVEMVRWWSRSGRKETPEELDHYFHLVLPR